MTLFPTIVEPWFCSVRYLLSRPNGCASCRQLSTTITWATISSRSTQLCPLSPSRHPRRICRRAASAQRIVGSNALSSFGHVSRWEWKGSTICSKGGSCHCLIKTENLREAICHQNMTIFCLNKKYLVANQLISIHIKFKSDTRLIAAEYLCSQANRWLITSYSTLILSIIFPWYHELIHNFTVSSFEWSLGCVICAAHCMWACPQTVLCDKASMMASDSTPSCYYYS